MVSKIGPVVDLTKVDKSEVLCYYAIKDNDYSGHMGARVSSIFVIFGVIIATAFIHLLDPAYKRIGPGTCVGESGNWGSYSWCAAIVLAAVLGIFTLDLVAEVYVERRFGHVKDTNAAEVMIDAGHQSNIQSSEFLNRSVEPKDVVDHELASTEDSVRIKQLFWQQITAFLILEFGIIVHSVIIGLNLGVTGSEFATLYPVLVFHQSFEGLGIGARMSAIPFGKRTWLPWILCAAYGLTTPVSIAIGLGLRHTYTPKSKTALIVQGVLNAVSAGLLIYSALVELLARDFFSTLIVLHVDQVLLTCSSACCLVLELWH
ncbi:Zinc-regulated transporter 1 [Colletotrichum truncatum]|uniref:Zinc-regulated transporter 1 n=1 Tax=Colletotrichum truncatum TaxID=5467 RepID=A0ACC3YDW4_COLTU|nr:Zinc-regulated transporter 1 [Colletotrichum truncatum]KAF6790276.1 Zinc-regulated transporter 1 [Colletotrichum truncatum]